MRRIARKTGISGSAEASCRCGRKWLMAKTLAEIEPAILTYINSAFGAVAKIPMATLIRASHRN
jgi:hypothetical protein